ncbi:tyrosine-type recombinase/integrase [Schlesneria sp. T3-172]|uniref:tyrosine-type recombinase/integrase n=1 Tax=Schlesneria sphaerica TaxID=3373610 RepID=UPI0037C78E49
MGRKKNLIPSMFIHKASGQARVSINGREYLLGPYGSEESLRRYADVLSRHAAGLPPVEKSRKVPPVDPGRSVVELCLKFKDEGLARFSKSEQHCQRAAMRVLRQMFGVTPISEFGPLRLRVVRQAMVDGDKNLKDADGKPCPRKPWSRQTVNRQVKRIQALFRWGVSWEIVPESIASALSTVTILTKGETSAAEATPRRAVAAEDIAAVRKELKPLHQDVLDLLGLTGARPGELVNLRMKDLDRTGDVWRSDLAAHKTSHKGKKRTLFFNATAQAILLRHLKDDPEARIFPCRRDNFGTAVKRACDRAGVVPFVPHEIRHTTATKLVDEVGLESAQRLLGHSDQAMTEHYSRMASKQAIEAVKSLG